MKNILALVILLTPAFSAAKDKLHAAKAPAGTRLTEYAASTAPLTLDTVAARFAEVDSRLQTLSVDFKQFVRLDGSDSSQQVEGNVLFRKPDRMRLVHRIPDAQTIVSDGVFLWIHRPSTNQVIQTRLEAWRRKEPLAKGLLDFGKSADLLKRYRAELSTVSAPGADGHRDFTIVLTPKPGESLKDAADFTLTLKASDRDFFPTEAALRVGRAGIRTIFSSIRLNPEISDELFHFSPPPASDVFSSPETP